MIPTFGSKYYYIIIDFCQHFKTPEAKLAPGAFVVVKKRISNFSDEIIEEIKYWWVVL